MKIGTIVLVVVLGGAAVASAVWVSTSINSPESTTTSDEESMFPELVGPPPKVVADEYIYDFGSMEKHTEQEHIFTLRNEGEGILKILKGKPTCKCTKFLLNDDEDLKRMDVAPGESVKVTVAWKVEGKSPEFQQDAPVHTNDPASPYVPFTIKGKVVSKYFVHPFRTLVAPDMVDNEPVSISAAVGSQLYDDFEVESIEKTSDLIEITARKLDGDDVAGVRHATGAHALDIVISPKIPVGRFHERFTIVLKNKDGVLSKEKMEVTLNRPGPFRVVGPKFDNHTMTLNMGAFSRDEGKKAQLSMFISNKEEVEDLYFKVVESTNEHATMSIEPDERWTGKGLKLLLKFEIAPGAIESKEGQGRAQWVVETNHPLLETVRFRAKYQAY